MNKVSSGKITITNVDKSKVQNNIEKALIFFKGSFEQYLSVEEDEMRLYFLKLLERELVIYFELFKDTKVLKEHIDEMVNMFNTIIQYKEKIYPEIYNIERDCFEKRFPFSTFK